MARTSNAYALTSAGQGYTEKDFAGHSAAIYKVLRRGPATVAELAQKAKIETTSDRPDRIIAFYCTSMKNAGLLKFATPAKAEKKAPAKKKASAKKSATTSEK